MLCALIMAGGKGERFWPLSTDEKPKQFLKLLSDKTMIQMTVERLESLIDIEKIFVVTGERYVDILREQLPRLPKRNIIVEPVGRNTAPCIALSAFVINKYYKDASIVVLPSDHLIVNEDKLLDAIRSAEEFIEKNDNSIVTLGMEPTRAETGYGYIKSGEVKEEISGFKIKKVDEFVEKPNKEKAEEYVKAGNFLWNGGMFIWKCSTIFKLTEKYLNKTYNILRSISEANGDEFNVLLKREYVKVDNISVDYGIMEKADSIYVIPCDFGWDDIGTWHAVERYRDKDEDNNVCVGDIKSIDSKNNILVGKKKPIVVVGLSDVFVVESDDIIFVGKKDDIERIKEIKKKVIK
ncbi:mannose-1-phosphate guanylyltransferase [Clostridium acetobutylicum]|uniref:mannose-1-phosphate guanylyltransferase n=1 Tax=Clostridium acetobutylicum (strain ATCC 824 / DSM 792 / JCM 1419 / IAM 19013 / LMG 5710 / NBRC 13948 / NRRL B-527 / VKM B-1787 / 2291 / W) TaxID=272562 RepID=Q97EN6_CLOAB|nr:MULTISPECIES: mannose-1-phosphate guanylyltransferase [Clostridium]AAK81012.1 Mannose-1-phosphate guanylyltransferase [Clostridium acetobutylicum ATCC 824]ADZ22115.1 Mannose-1-phosphate guanylyltransferase [Clostridium acetobutylicum EA 2018]AEI34688.1 mannose-1-phosphate guanylyltransferase [Clostridium acetobutylicum DSM 1731]AWV78577.1 mannose-1-phosphate guanylyltransferase [Clostridium acetobutylicum]MBC2393437.1 mannose-1-phosphate guanylyltransferase [Clostridium acetobutylicum]